MAEVCKDIHKIVFVNRCLMILLNTEKKNSSSLKTSSFMLPSAVLDMTASWLHSQLK